MSTLEITNKIKELRELQRMAEEITAEIDAIKDSIKNHMEAINAETLSGTDYKISYKTVNSSRLDSAALKKELPEIAAQYTKNTIYKRLDIK